MSQAAAFHLERYTRIDRGGKVGVDGKMDLDASFELAIEKKQRARCDKLDECFGKVGKIDTIDMSRKGGNACSKSLMRIPLCLALPNVRGLLRVSKGRSFQGPSSLHRNISDRSLCKDAIVFLSLCSSYHCTPSSDCNLHVKTTKPG